MSGGKKETHGVHEDAVDAGEGDCECILLPLGRRHRHEHEPWPRQRIAPHPPLTVFLPLLPPLRQLAYPPVPLPVLLVHPRQHLVRHPAHQQPRPRHRPRRVPLAVHLDQAEVAGDVVALERRGVDRHMRLAVEQPRFVCGGGGGHRGGSRGVWVTDKSGIYRQVDDDTLYPSTSFSLHLFLPLSPPLSLPLFNNRRLPLHNFYAHSQHYPSSHASSRNPPCIQRLFPHTNSPAQ